MPGTVLGDIASRCRLYLATKTSYVGVDVGRLACPLHHPMVCSRQMTGQGFLSSAALSRCAAVGGGAILGDAMPPCLGI
jgi:hypothetical protein